MRSFCALIFPRIINIHIHRHFHFNFYKQKLRDTRNTFSERFRDNIVHSLEIQLPSTTLEKFFDPAIPFAFQPGFVDNLYGTYESECFKEFQPIALRKSVIIILHKKLNGIFECRLKSICRIIAFHENIVKGKIHNHTLQAKRVFQHWRCKEALYVDDDLIF